MSSTTSKPFPALKTLLELPDIIMEKESQKQTNFTQFYPTPTSLGKGKRRNTWFCPAKGKLS